MRVERPARAGSRTRRWPAPGRCPTGGWRGWRRARRAGTVASAGQTRATSHGRPAPWVRWLNVVAPTAAKAAWHSETWPDVDTSRPSDRKIEDEGERGSCTTGRRAPTTAGTRHRATRPAAAASDRHAGRDAAAAVPTRRRRMRGAAGRDRDRRAHDEQDGEQHEERHAGRQAVQRRCRRHELGGQRGQHADDQPADVGQRAGSRSARWRTRRRPARRAG